LAESSPGKKEEKILKDKMNDEDSDSDFELSFDLNSAEKMDNSYLTTFPLKLLLIKINPSITIRP